MHYIEVDCNVLVFSRVQGGWLLYVKGGCQTVAVDVVGSEVCHQSVGLL